MNYFEKAFQVKDVHGILYLTVYDEDKNHKSEFLGKIAVPLLKMEVRIAICKLTWNETKTG